MVSTGHREMKSIGIEIGGTHTRVARGTSAAGIEELRRLPTTTPAETIDAIAATVSELTADDRIRGFGLASFGPIDVDPGSPGCGTILRTPKPGWSGFPVLRGLFQRLGVPGVVQTDVNAAVLAEMQRGAARGAARAAYLTVGTGIGAGVMAAGQFAGAPHHPEFGHTPIRRHPNDRGFAGVCPFHGDCLEGLASGPAIAARRGGASQRPSPDDPVYDIVADAVGQGCLSLFLSFRVERIVLGGGVMATPGLVAKVRSAFAQHLAGYLDAEPADLIVPSAFDDCAGVTGALLIAAHHARSLA